MKSEAYKLAQAADELFAVEKRAWIEDPKNAGMPFIIDGEMLIKVREHLATKSSKNLSKKGRE